VTRNTRHSTRLTLSLAAVYLIWGTSFLATKIGINSLPGALFSGLRFVLAGAVLTFLARILWHQRFPVRARDWLDILFMGLFTVVFSTGLNVWAMHFISSSESALLNSTGALWIAVFGSFGARGHPLNRMALLGLCIGIAGTALTLSPRFSVSARVAVPYLVALVACLSWAVATTYYRQIDTSIGSLMFIGLQMLTGGLLQVAVGVAYGQLGQWHANLSGLLALGYLSLFSSGLAYTAYGWLARNATPAIIGTYSYVNPAVAAFVGWLFLREKLLPIQFAGMLVVLVGVALVTTSGTTPHDDRALEEPSSP